MIGLFFFSIFLIVLGFAMNRDSRANSNVAELDYWSDRIMAIGQEQAGLIAEARPYLADGQDQAAIDHYVPLFEAKFAERESAVAEYKRVFADIQHLLPASVARDKRKSFLALDAMAEDQRQDLIEMRSMCSSLA